MQIGNWQDFDTFKPVFSYILTILCCFEKNWGKLRKTEEDFPGIFLLNLFFVEIRKFSGVILINL